MNEKDIITPPTDKESVNPEETVNNEETVLCPTDTESQINDEINIQPSDLCDSPNDEKAIDLTEEETETEDSDNNIEVTEETEIIDEDDIAYVAERITGERHSKVTTAAPIRTRMNQQSPENDSSLLERKDTAGISQSIADHSKIGSTFILTLSTAIFAIIFMIFSIIVINTVYNNNDKKSRFADYSMTDNIDPQSILTVESKTPEHPIETEQFEQSESNNDTQNSDSANKSEPENKKYNVTLNFFENEDISIITEKITFGELLSLAGCELSETDRPSVDNDFVIAADTIIDIDKVQYVNVTVTEDIPYESEQINTDFIPRGTTNFISYGENGMKETLYNVEYINGVEVNRTYISEQITKWPVTEKYEYGTGGSFVGNDGITYTYSHRRVVPATYYDIEGITYIGIDADETVIAVDPNYIPLGTILYVKNDKYDFGKRIAADTGSLVDGWEVDIWISHDNPQLADFAFIGYHYDMEIYYIDQ